MPIKMTFSKLMVSACILGALSSSVQAQDNQGGGRQGRGQGQGGPGGGGGRMMGMGMGMMGGGLTSLLGMEEVRKELKIDEDQAKELQTIRDSMREQMMSMRPAQGQQPDPAAMAANMEKIQKLAQEAEGKLEEILDPKQLDRLLGLSVQRDGLRALTGKLVAAKLEITDEQKAKMAEVEKDVGEKMRELFSGGFNPESRDKMREIREKADEKIKEVLTAKQKEDMEAMKGPKFEFPQPNFGGFGGPGGGNGGPGGGGRPGRGNRPGSDN